MSFERKKRLLSLLVVFSLVFSLSVPGFAAPAPVPVEAASAAVVEAAPALAGTSAAVVDELALDASQSAEGLGEETAPAASQATAAAIAPAAAPSAAGIGVLAVEPSALNIKSVEVLNGGSMQILYRNEVYAGVAANGEDPAKYYTTQRDFNLKDPRIFNVEFTVPADVIGSADPQDFLNSVNFTYGGYALSSWGNGNNWRGNTAIIILNSKQIVAPVNAGDDYVVTAAIRVNSAYSSSNSSVGNNIPYNSYYGGTQNSFGSSQTADNRAFFQAGPTNKGPGTYALAAVAGGETLASTGIRIGPYDGYHSWTDINQFSQDLIFALNGEEVDVNEKPMGVLAKGYITKDANGNYVKGSAATDVYIEVSILGYGLTDNFMAANATYNNYSQFNAIWNVAVAKNESTIDDYLKPGGVKDLMNSDPQVLIDKYKNSEPEDIDMIIPFYQNNVHSDEISGTDTMIHFIDNLIEGGKNGKVIPYKTYQDNQLTWNYRPSGNNNTGYTAYNHLVTGGLTGAFAQATSRTQTSIDTGAVLDKFIIVNTLCSNPDGKAAMRRTNRYGLDINRDTVYATQPEAIALTQDLAKWDPIVMLEWHGYVTQMLIEPCTAPHCLNYEPDLTLNNMIQLAYYGGKALTASTGFNRFHLPWDSFAYDWDDGGNVYGPMFAMLFGAMGWTIELPYSNQDALEAGDSIAYAMMNALMTGETAYYDGNVLNRSIGGKDDHSVDNKYASLRKSTILNKLEFKRRGVENIDSMDADKYFIEVVSGVARYMGRIRHDDGDGGVLPYFPDYLLVPSSPDTQYNVAEAYRTLDFTMNYGAKVSRTTAPVTYNGVTYPAGTYLYDMKQGLRNFIYEIMGKGYDATSFASMYADIYCNFPDTRGFDCVEVWAPGLFDGKLEAVDSVMKEVNITGTPDEYVTFKSSSTDSVRFVNLLLSNRSSGPSFGDGKAPVWMLRKTVKGVGTMSDYIIKASDLYKVNLLVDNPDLGLKGCHLEGKYISDLPKEAVPLVEPVITLNSTRNAATTGGAIFWALDDYLGFGSMKNADGSDYNGNAANAARAGANVAVMYNASTSGTLLSTIKSNKMGLVLVQSAGSLTSANYGTSNTAAPSTGTFNDVALYGNYNVDDSLITANYASTETIYARGNYFTGNVPAGSKILFKSKNGGAFIGGFQNTSGSKTTFQDRTMMFSTILKGGGITGKPIQSVTFGSNMFYRPHYQKFYPLLAISIFAGAAGILDDQNDPTVSDFSLTDVGGAAIEVQITAEDAKNGVAGESGIASYAFYQWNAATGAYDLKAEQASASYEFDGVSIADNFKLKAVVKDYAGNEVEQVITPITPTSTVTEADAGNLKVATSLVNFGDAGQEGIQVILAVYDATGRLVATKAAPPVSLDAGGQHTVVSELGDIVFGEDWTAKVFVWDSKFAPLTDAYMVDLD